jgi:hypothetical protein
MVVVFKDEQWQGAKDVVRWLTETGASAEPVLLQAIASPHLIQSGDARPPRGRRWTDENPERLWC